MFRASSAHHQEFSTLHSGLVIFMQVLMTASKQSQDGTAEQLVSTHGSEGAKEGVDKWAYCCC